MSDIFREVDEEVRKDELARLWQRWGKRAMAGVVALLVAVGVFSGWREWQVNRRAEAGTAFALASELVAAGQYDEAAKAFVALAEDGPAGYAGLARLRAGHAYAAAGQREAALATLDGLARQADAEPFLRDSARLAGAALLVDDGDPADVRARLAPLLEAGSRLRASARELEGLLALRTGDSAAAAAIFRALAEDASAPSGLRLRAGEIAASLGGGGDGS